MKNTKIAIIGCGNLGESILKGWIENPAFKNENITVTKRNSASIEHYATYGVSVSTNNLAATQNADIILFALKPYTILGELDNLSQKVDLSSKTLVSLASGVSISKVQEVVGENVSIFRAMPNTAAGVSESLTCLSSSSSDNEEIAKVKQCFESIGEVVSINEELMDAATVLGACGIAYVLRFMRAMIQGGVQIGFDVKTASKIVSQTTLGAAKLILENESHPEAEIDKVTTPKGCTIEGLNEMEHNGFSSALIKGLVTSFKQIQD